MVGEATVVTEVGCRRQVGHLHMCRGRERREGGEGRGEGRNILHVSQCVACSISVSLLVGTCMVRQNRPAVSMGSVAIEHPAPRKMGAVWFGSVLVQNLKYSSKAPSALHCGVGWGE